MAQLIYDHREESSGVPALLVLEGIDVESQSLSVGDYLVSQDICIERKSAPDFVSSLKDGRLFRQAENMRQFYSRSIFILEGRPTFAAHSLYGAFASLIRKGITFINLKDEKETVSFLTRLAIQEARGPSPRKLAVKKKKGDANEIAEDVLAALPGISLGKAKAILEHLGGLRGVALASAKELQEVPGIGKKTAEQIESQFTHSYGQSFWEKS